MDICVSVFSSQRPLRNKGSYLLNGRWVNIEKRKNSRKVFYSSIARFALKRTLFEFQFSACTGNFGCSVCIYSVTVCRLESKDNLRFTNDISAVKCVTADMLDILKSIKEAYTKNVYDTKTKT